MGPSRLNQQPPAPGPDVPEPLVAGRTQESVCPSCWQTCLKAQKMGEQSRSEDNTVSQSGGAWCRLSPSERLSPAARPHSVDQFPGHRVTLQSRVQSPSPGQSRTIKWQNRCHRIPPTLILPAPPWLGSLTLPTLLLIMKDPLSSHCVP